MDVPAVLQTLVTRRKVLAPQVLFRKAFTLLGAVVMMWCGVHAAQAQAADSKPIRILAFGDSLTAGYGLELIGDSFPVQLEQALKAKGYNVTLLPGGLSGDTSSGGRSRLDWSLAEKPDAVIVELGGNDALRGIDPSITADNMLAIVKHIQQDGTPVLIAGMMAPPNLGRDYAARFNPLYEHVAQETGVPLYPFFLDGAITVPGLMQADHIHPNPAGVKVIVGRILPSVEKLIAAVEKRRAGSSSPAKK